MPQASAIRAGRAYMEIFADDSKLIRGLRGIETRMKQMGSRVAGVGRGISLAGAGVSALGAAALAPVAAAVKQFTAFGDTLDKMSARTGVGVEALAELGFAAEQGGADLATVEKGFNGLSRALFDASRGSAEAVDSLAKLGLTYKQLEGLNPEDQFQAVADALANIQDESVRGAVAQKLFGRAGRQLLPMLSSLREIRQEARDLGLVLSREDTTAAAGLADAFNRIRRTVSGAFLQLGAAVAEPLTKALKAITTITAGVNKWVAANRPLVQQFVAASVAVVALGTAISAVGLAVVGIGATIGSVGVIAGSVATIITGAFAGIAATIAFLASPIGALVAVVGGLGAAIVYGAAEGSGALTALGEMFSGVFDTAKTAWSGIVAALSSGDLQAAGEIATAALEVAWLTVTGKMQEAWSKFAGAVQNIWIGVVESIVKTGANIYFGIAGYFDKLSTALVDGFSIATTYITGLIDTIQTAIAKAIVKAMEFFKILNAESAAGAIGVLNQDAQKRAAGRQSSLDQGISDRNRGLAERDQARQAEAKQFGEVAGQIFNERRQRAAPDTSGLSAAQERLAQARDRLTGLSQAAQDQAAADVAAKKPELAGATNAAALEQVKSESVGSFIGAAAARQSSGGVQDVIADASQKTAENTKRMRELLQDNQGEGVLA
jgi:hypothetical protein